METTLVDFRNPSAIGRYSQQVDSTCRMLGGSSPNCIESRETLGVMLQANSCFYQWNPVCQDRLKGRLDIATPCANGDYDTSPLFKAYLCPPVLPPTDVYVPLPPAPTIADVDAAYTRENDSDYSNILILACLVVAGYFIVKRLK